MDSGTATGQDGSERLGGGSSLGEPRVSDKFTVESVRQRRDWAPRLFSLRTTRDPDFRFIPGQFARIGLPGASGEALWRPYSIVSAPDDDYLEFFSVVVADGEFSPRLAALQAGDRLLIDKTNYGFLTAERFIPGRDLWMLSTGTGLGPFLSILAYDKPWQEFENLIVVHSVRSVAELAYRDELRDLAGHPLLGDRRHQLRYVPVVTRERCEGALCERITTLLDNGGLVAHTGLALSREHSRFMVCGNPEMVAEVRKRLQDMGFAVGRRGKPGHMAFEKYW